MSFSTYLINLDTAAERLQRMDARLKELGIAYERVSAVIGDQLSEPIGGFNPSGYRIRTGKQTNKREVGCYFSHMEVMRRFLKGDSSHALILEDDAELPDGFAALLDKVMATTDHWDLLRLSSSRKGNYLDICDIDDEHRLSINTKVLKNTAGYMISREGAKRCLEGLLPMCRPYDVALDRDWSLGIRTACVVPLPIGHGEIPSQIPRTDRAPFWRATTFHLFHLLDRIRRSQYRRRIAAIQQDQQQKT